MRLQKSAVIETQKEADVIITASFLKRFWKDQNGAALSEIVIILVIIGVGLTAAAILVKSSISQVHVSR